MPRSRATLTVPIVLAIVLIGVFAMQSRAKDDSDKATRTRKNSAPVARADVVATTAGTPVRVDVLANDTDADGDQLVFQILRATGGTATLDDGSGPFDADDDRVLFTPDPAAAAQAVVVYRAVDPGGASGESLLTVVINADGVLPAGVASEEVGSDAGRCGEPASTTTTVGPATTATIDGSSSGRGDSGPRRRATSPAPAPTVSSRTSPPAQPTQPTATPPPPTPTTTRPASQPQTTPRQCGPPPTSGSDAEEDAWERCVEENSD